MLNISKTVYLLLDLLYSKINLLKSTQVTDDDAESHTFNIALKCTQNSIDNMKIIYNRNLKNQAEMNEGLYNMVHILKKGQCNLYKFNNIINIKLNLILEHFKINVSIFVKQFYSSDLNSPISQISNIFKVNSKSAGTSEKQLNSL